MQHKQLQISGSAHTCTYRVLEEAPGQERQGQPQVACLQPGTANFSGGDGIIGICYHMRHQLRHVHGHIGRCSIAWKCIWDGSPGIVCPLRRLPQAQGMTNSSPSISCSPGIVKQDINAQTLAPVRRSIRPSRHSGQQDPQPERHSGNTRDNSFIGQARLSARLWMSHPTGSVMTSSGIHHVRCVQHGLRTCAPANPSLHHRHAICSAHHADKPCHLSPIRPSSALRTGQSTRGTKATPTNTAAALTRGRRQHSLHTGAAAVRTSTGVGCLREKCR
jgi:hypothetical protein